MNGDLTLNAASMCLDRSTASLEYDDVVNAYRLLLGRNPENGPAVDGKRGLTTNALVAALARSAEFAQLLERLVDRGVAPHVFLSRDHVVETLEWARRHADLFSVPPDAPASPATLIAILVAADCGGPAIEQLGLRDSAVLRRLVTDPCETLAHRLWTAADHADAMALDLLLFADASGGAAGHARNASLLGLIEDRLRGTRFRAEVAAVVMAGGGAPALRLPSEDVAGLWQWFAVRFGERRVGAVDVSGRGLLVALFSLQPVEDILARAFPAEYASLSDELLAMTLGDEREAAADAAPALRRPLDLDAVTATTQDLGAAYLCILGRHMEDAAAQAHRDPSLLAMLTALIGSFEFRDQVLYALAGGFPAPHVALDGDDRRRVFAWLGDRLAAPACDDAAAPLNPATLLTRALSLPPVALALERSYGPLWRDAAARLDHWRLHDATAVSGPQAALRAVTEDIAQVRTILRRLEALLPQLHSADPREGADYTAFRRQHAVPPPPASAAGMDGRGGTIGVAIDGSGFAPEALQRTLRSIVDQTCPRWRARIVAGGAAAARFAAADARIVCVEDDASPAATEEFALLPAPGAVFAPTAFAWFMHVARSWPSVGAIYADEDRIEAAGQRDPRHVDPVFRGCFDAVALESRNVCGEGVFARRAALDLATAQCPPGAGRWALWTALAGHATIAHIPRVLVSIQRDAASLPAPDEDAPKARATPGARPRIDIVIPTRNGGRLVAECVRSLLATALDPGALDILVIDNGSDDAETLAVLAQGVMSRRFSVLRADEPFNWAGLNNRAAAATGNDILLFLNDDTRALTPGWDDCIRGDLARPEIGAVGALLLYENLTVQHAGMVLGVDGLVTHEGVGAAMTDAGPSGRWRTMRNVGAVTGALMACRRDAFLLAGGFDAANFPITMNDVDFCLRLRSLGLRILYDPGIRFIHLESISRGHDDATPEKRRRAALEASRLRARWSDAVELDPGYNPHWSRAGRPFTTIREPSMAEIERHIARAASSRPWQAVSDPSSTS